MMTSVEMWQEVKRRVERDSRYGYNSYICAELWDMKITEQITEEEHRKALDALRPLARARHKALGTTALWPRMSPKRIEFIDRQIKNAQRRKQ